MCIVGVSTGKACWNMRTLFLYVCLRRGPELPPLVIVNLAVSHTGICNESVGAKCTRDRHFLFIDFQSVSLDPKNFCMEASGSLQQCGVVNINTIT